MEESKFRKIFQYTRLKPTKEGKRSTIYLLPNFISGNVLDYLK